MLAFLAAALLALHPAGPVLAATVGPPTALAATPGSTQVSLSWSAPAVGGNPAITDYQVEYSSDVGVTWSQFAHSASVATTSTVTGLTNGQSYVFRVSAVNSDGVGSPSDVAVAVPLSNHSPNDPAMFLACPTGITPPAGFTDTTSTDVDCIKYYGITKGTTATTYSPFGTVTRWQMALFITRMAGPAGVTLGSGSGQGFTDILGKSAEIQTAVNQIKQLGITVGKTATTFAPDDNVTREEMALFISRFLTNATSGPGGNTEYVSGSSGPKVIKSIDTDHNFVDLNKVAMWESQQAIIGLWNLGVTDVQAVSSFDPQADMTRRAMATFVAGALSHTNARPSGLVLQADSYRVSDTPWMTFSVTHRDTAFQPISGSMVNTFKFEHTLSSSVVRFDSAGNCSGVTVGILGTTRCQVTAADGTTDAGGNLSTFQLVPAAINKTDYWAWTAAVGTLYDNDVHSAAASKITVETTQ